MSGESLDSEWTLFNYDACVIRCPLRLKGELVLMPPSPLDDAHVFCILSFHVALCQRLSYFNCQILQFERLLYEVHAYVQHAVVSDDVGCVS